MEKTVHFVPQEQVSKIVTPDKGEVVKAPTQGKRNDDPPIIQPWAKIVKTEPEDRTLKSKYYTLEQHKWFEHLDARWSRTVWWSDYERDPSKPIVWSHAPSWKPETPEEAKERCKNQSGYRLQHNGVKVGGIYKFFKIPIARLW